MENSSWTNLIQCLDGHLKKHQMAEASQLMAGLDISSIAPQYRHQLANIARRLGDNGKALKILWPNIYGVQAPTEMDILEYAACLRKAGLPTQSRSLLNRLPSSGERRLHLAFGDISVWDYQEAQLHLESFLDLGCSDKKKRIVAEVNLAACYVMNEDQMSATKLLDRLLPETQKDHLHLHLNCLELQAQSLRRKGDLQEAQKVLSTAMKLAHGGNSATNMFLKKWHLILQLELGELSLDSIHVQGFLRWVRAQTHWHTLRDWDFQLGVIFNNRELKERVYFGTPYKYFRQKLAPEFSVKTCSWQDKRRLTSIEQVLDLLQPQDVGLPYGLALHRLLLLFTSDFYAPWSVEKIFDCLFADEIYDPYSSNKKVYRLIEKLKMHIKKMGWNLDLNSTPHGYRMRPAEGLLIQLPLERQWNSSDAFFKNLVESFSGDRAISCDELAERYPISKQKWQRQLKRLKELGELESLAGGRSSKYLLKAS